MREKGVKSVAERGGKGKGETVRNRPKSEFDLKRTTQKEERIEYDYSLGRQREKGGEGRSAGEMRTILAKSSIPKRKGRAPAIFPTKEGGKGENPLLPWGELYTVGKRPSAHQKQGSIYLQKEKGPRRGLRSSIFDQEKRHSRPL